VGSLFSSRTFLNQFLVHNEATIQSFAQVSDKKQNPLIATQASPGMGNSTFIDVLAMLSFQQIKELSPAQSTDAFHRSVAESVCVTVDYNGYQGVFPFDQKNAVVGFSLRILHSYDLTVPIFLKLEITVR
jgi:hypothetical protein